MESWHCFKCVQIQSFFWFFSNSFLILMGNKIFFRNQFSVNHEMLNMISLIKIMSKETATSLVKIWNTFINNKNNIYINFAERLFSGKKSTFLYFCKCSQTFTWPVCLCYLSEYGDMRVRARHQILFDDP